MASRVPEIRFQRPEVQSRWDAWLDNYIENRPWDPGPRAMAVRLERVYSAKFPRYHAMIDDDDDL